MTVDVGEMVKFGFVFSVWPARFDDVEGEGGSGGEGEEDGEGEKSKDSSVPMGSR